MNNEHKLLQTIIEIAKSTNNAGSMNFVKRVSARQIKTLTQYLSCSADEAVLFAIVFKLFFNCNNTFVNLGDIASHLNVETLEALTLAPLLKVLVRKKLIGLDYRHIRDNINNSEFNYRIKKEMVNRIIKQDYVNTATDVYDSISFLRVVRSRLNDFAEKEITIEEVMDELSEMEQEHPQIFFVERIVSLELDSRLKLLLLYVIVEFYEGQTDIILNYALDKIFWGDTMAYDFVKAMIIRKQGILFKNNLLNLTTSDWQNDIAINLTKDGAVYLFGADAQLILLSNTENNARNKIDFEKITQKPLFYNDVDLPQIDFMHDILKEENFQNIIARLKENKLAQGVCILLHGLPGTGKTETVYQVAKATQRHIFNVDISTLKSAWFGESQKLVKQMFNAYYEFAENQTHKPILLINEADGIISKRKEDLSTTTAHTENAIQNILLQEMEDFNGILMATTNMMSNIDAAFNRRFLFKVELTMPDKTIRHQMIKHYLPHLNDNDCWILAEDFEFSGGVLQNIIRKSAMHQVIYNALPDINWYVLACKEENSSNLKKPTKIGF